MSKVDKKNGQGMRVKLFRGLVSFMWENEMQNKWTFMEISGIFSYGLLPIIDPTTVQPLQ